MASISPTTRLRISGARGESFTDILRRLGVKGTLPTDTDGKAIENYAAVVIEQNPGFKGDKGNPGGNVMSVAAKTLADGMMIPAGTQLVQTSSYDPTRPGEGSSLYAEDGSDAATKATYPDFVVAAAEGRYFAQVKTMPMVTELGIFPDGSDVVAKLEKAIDWVSDKGVNKLILPDTKGGPGFYFSRGLNIDRPITLEGQGGGRAGNPRGKTMIYTAPGADGITIHAYNTGPRVGDPRAVGGDSSQIKGLYLWGDPNDLQTKGIRLRARASIVNNTTAYYGYSCAIIATAGAGGDTEGNANSWLVQGCRFDTPRQDCLLTRGGDANAGLAIDCEMLGANGWGVNNEAFLSNTFIGLHTHTNGNYGNRRGGTWGAGVNHDAGQGIWWWVPRIGATPAALASTAPGSNSAVWILWNRAANAGLPLWQSGNMNYRPGGPFASMNANSGSVFLSCYSEGDMGPSQYNFPAQRIGGTQAAGVIGGAGLGNRFGLVETPIGFVAYDAVTQRYATLGGNIGDGIISEFYDPTNFTGPLSLRLSSGGTRVVMSGNGRQNGNEYYAMHGANAAHPGHLELQKVFANLGAPLASNDAAIAAGVQDSCLYKHTDGTIRWKM